jgi:hypothetical protein
MWLLNNLTTRSLYVLVVVYNRIIVTSRTEITDTERRLDFYPGQ